MVINLFYLKYISYLIVLLSFIACSSTPKPVDGTDEAFQKDAIYLKYSSSYELNSYDNQPHVIPLVIYQLSDINSFDGLLFV